MLFTPATMRRIRRRAAMIAAVAALSSVSLDDTQASNEKKGTTPPPVLELTWPEPPLAPRIKVIGMLASEADLGKKMSYRDTLLKFLTGNQPKVEHIYQPRDVVVSEDGLRVYASDFGVSSVFVFDLETRKVRTFRAERPFGLALDDQENVYVAEEEARRVEVFDRTGTKLRAFTHESLVRPTDVTIDRARRRVYVADPARKASPEHTVKIFDLDGKFLGTIGNGKGDCQGCLLFPTYVAVDAAGRVYVSSTLNSRVEVFDPDGKYVRTIGGRGTQFGLFDKPKGIAVDSFGNIHVVDSAWSNVQIFNEHGEVLLFYGARGSYPGLLKNPTGITIGKDNKIYVADYLNYRVVVYQLVNTSPEDSFASAPAAEKR